MEVALTLVKPGGYIFLDNTDLPNDDCRIAAAGSRRRQHGCGCSTT